MTLNPLPKIGEIMSPFPAENAEQAVVFNAKDAVDELGALKAQIAALQDREDVLKAALIATGQESIDGTQYRASISKSERNNRDKSFKERIEELIAEHISHQYVTAHTIVSPVVTVRVSARKSGSRS